MPFGPIATAATLQLYAATTNVVLQESFSEFDAPWRRELVRNCPMPVARPLPGEHSFPALAASSSTTRSCAITLPGAGAAIDVGDERPARPRAPRRSRRGNARRPARDAARGGLAERIPVPAEAESDKHARGEALMKRLSPPPLPALLASAAWPALADTTLHVMSWQAAYVAGTDYWDKTDRRLRGREPRRQGREQFRCVQPVPADADRDDRRRLAARRVQRRHQDRRARPRPATW